MTGFNDSLWIAGESLAISLSTVCAVEYDSDGEKVQYGPNDCALPKVRPPTLQGMLAHLEAEFDQGTSQVSDDPLNLETVWSGLRRRSSLFLLTTSFFLYSKNSPFSLIRPLS